MNKRPGRFSLVCLVFALVVSLITPSAFALDPQPEPPIPITILIDGKLLTTDASPVIENGRTLVPLRAIFEALEAKVDWNDSERSINATKGDLTVHLQIGNASALKNGTPVTVDVPPQIVNGRTLVPVRFVSESLGAGVGWDNAKRQVTIITASGPPVSGAPETETQRPSVQPPKTDLNRLRILGIDDSDPKMPRLRLSNNKLVPLMPETIVPSDKFQSLYPTPAAVQKRLNITPPEATVDWRQYQTSIKDQDGRNTCVSFAVLAAMEAAYKRLDPVKYKNLDLSEQYSHLLQKMVFLKDVAPSQPHYYENALGRWGYSGTLYAMALFARPYSVPKEELLPYVAGGGSYENTHEYGDKPYLDPDYGWLTQKDVDDVNFMDTEFPLAALDGATYGINSYSTIPWGSLTDLNYYKNVLAAGYDIAFSANIMDPDPTPDDYIWNPGKKKIGGHAMLMVGYDDDRQCFIVKNSWGYDSILENGFTLFSYDWVTAGHITEAGYITSVITNPNEYTRPEQRFLGRWKMDNDGWKGTLDIYHVPGFFQNDWPREDKFGTSDKRIGTYYDDQGKAYRVNGSIEGNRIEFFIDFDQPNLKFDEVRGKRFIGYLFGWEPTLMAGTMASDGQPYGFYATKEDYFSGAGAAGDGIKPSDFAGVWDMDHDGWKGTLTIYSVDSSNKINASYQTREGKTLAVTGYVTEGRRLMMDIAFGGNSPQPFSGIMFSWEKGIMTGSTPEGGSYYGWVAVRTGPPPLVDIPKIIAPSIPIRTLR
ncbi:MAG: hypothetical protein HPY50_05845 [Firmicutes bacterium]|nr:hypothetical protein [Bacillota bacterium]